MVSPKKGIVSMMSLKKIMKTLFEENYIGCFVVNEFNEEYLKSIDWISSLWMFKPKLT